MLDISIGYKRNNNENNMVVEGSFMEQPFEEKMIKSNDIGCLLSYYTMQLNGITRYYYNISGKESLADYLDVEELNRDNLKKIILYIHMAYTQLGNYLIDESHIILQPETIYLNRNTDNYGVKLCYFPAKNSEPATVQFMSILELMLSKVNYQNEDMRQLIYKLYEVATTTDYTLMDLVKVITEDEEAVQCVEMMPEQDQVYVEPEVNSIESLYEEEEYDFWDSISMFFARLFKKKQKAEFREGVGDDFIVEPDMEISEPTVLLKPEELRCAGKLIYDGNGEVDEDDYMVQKDVFHIGSSGGNNDATLNSRAVSRHHAKITRQGTDYFIEDMNSTNGTFVNGYQLNYKEPRKLNMLDTILFADVAYVFM